MSPSAAHRQFRQKIQQMRLLCEILQTDFIHQHSPARACNGVTASGCVGRCDDWKLGSLRACGPRLAWRTRKPNSLVVLVTSLRKTLRAACARNSELQEGSKAEDGGILNGRGARPKKKKESSII